MDSMKYLLIFGASITHGMGAQNGWADMVKAGLHAQMYTLGPVPNNCWVYELGVPGDTARDVLARMETEIHARVPHGAAKDAYIVFAAGLNDSKAKDDANNYLETADDFATTVTAVVHLAKTLAGKLLVVGLTPVDESKTTPMISAGTNNKNYYRNERIRQFEHTMAKVCKAENVPFVPVFDHVPKQWQRRYLFADGLHPNDQGHRWLFKHLNAHIKAFLK